MYDMVYWWPIRNARDAPRESILVFRYDWPDERIYQVGTYKHDRTYDQWVDPNGNPMPIPDYFAYAQQVIPFLHIPEKCECTWK